MADSFIQLTTDGAGKQLDTVIVNMGVGTTQVHREKMVIADPLSTSAFAPVTSSAGLLASLSSGTVLSTAATNPWSSAPGFNVPVVSVSSGLVQVSGTPLVNVVGTSSGVAVVTTSGGLLVTAIPSSNYTVLATAATNPWSSAPGFNVPVVTVSSGLVQISGTPLVNVVGTSSGVAVVTTSGGLTVTAIQSSVYTVTATAATNPWSSAPGFNLPVVSASSGLVQISGVPTVVISSSAGLSTVAVVSASSGLVQISGTVGLSTAASGNLVSIVTSSAGNLVATTSQGLQVQQSTSKIVPVLAASSGLISIDLWQATSRISPTFQSATTISKMSSSPGNLFLVTGFTTSTGGIGATIPALIRFYNASTSNVTMNTGVQMILPLGMQSSSTSLTGQGDVANPLSIAPFMPLGVGFSAACSFDIVQTATSTAAVAGTGYITGLYSTN